MSSQPRIIGPDDAAMTVDLVNRTDGRGGRLTPVMAFAIADAASTPELTTNIGRLWPAAKEACDISGPNTVRNALKWSWKRRLADGSVRTLSGPETPSYFVPIDPDEGDESNPRRMKNYRLNPAVRFVLPPDGGGGGGGRRDGGDTPDGSGEGLSAEMLTELRAIRSEQAATRAVMETLVSGMGSLRDAVRDTIREAIAGHTDGLDLGGMLDDIERTVRRENDRMAARIVEAVAAARSAVPIPPSAASLPPITPPAARQITPPDARGRDTDADPVGLGEIPSKARVALAALRTMGGSASVMDLKAHVEREIGKPIASGFRRDYTGPLERLGLLYDPGSDPSSGTSLKSNNRVINLLPAAEAITA